MEVCRHFCRNAEHPTTLPAEGLQTVFDQVAKDLGEARFIAQHERQARVKMGLDGGSLGGRCLFKQQDIGDRLVDIDRLGIKVGDRPRARATAQAAR